jgi:hypothetical protein
VTVDLSGCCDIALCEAQANGQPATLAGGVVTGVTDANGRVDFILMGAARDPGTAIPPFQYGGCGPNGMVVSATAVVAPGETVVMGNATAVCLDQNGAGGGSNGTSTGDLSNLYNLFGSFALGGPYKGRGDQNADRIITAGDVGALLQHLGRLALTGGVGCTAPFEATPGCP